LYAKGAANVAITGRGTINGNGRAFLIPHMERLRQLGVPLQTKVDRLEAEFHEATDDLCVRDWRPGPMVAFIECRDVRLRDVHLVDSPSFTVWPVGCERVTIHAVTIQNDRRTPNTD